MATAGAVTPDSGMEVGIGIVAVVAASALSYGLWRGSPSGAKPAARLRPAGDGTPAAPPEAALADLRAIAELDAHYAAGQIDAPTYRRLRDGLKARVRAALDDRDSGTD